MAGSTEKKGVYIPESIMKVIQSLMVALMLGAYGMAWKHEASISTLELVVATQEAKIEELEEEAQTQDDSLNGIQISLTTLTLGQVHTNEGIAALKLALAGL